MKTIGVEYVFKNFGLMKIIGYIFAALLAAIVFLFFVGVTATMNEPVTPALTRDQKRAKGCAVIKQLGTRRMVEKYGAQDAEGMIEICVAAGLY
jgi:hypothetical protein